MTVLETIENIVDNFAIRGEEIPSFAILGPVAFSKLYREASYGSINREGFNIIYLHTPHGSIAVLRTHIETNHPTDYISVGGRTMLDIIAEEILLGAE